MICHGTYINVGVLFTLAHYSSTAHRTPVVLASQHDASVHLHEYISTTSVQTVSNKVVTNLPKDVLIIKVNMHNSCLIKRFEKK